MTQAEFYAAIKQSRKDYLDIIAGVNKNISKLYIYAADQVAEKIKSLSLKGNGTGLTAESLKALERQLRITGSNTAGGVQAHIIDGINKNASITSQPHIDFINDGIKESGISFLNDVKITEMYAAINRRLTDITYSRLWADGYKFSERVWGGLSSVDPTKSIPGLYGYWQSEIKSVVSSGIAQNRDVLLIAKDLSAYAREGKSGLVKRYGELVQGTKRFIKRIPQGIDWRALRLARSELYASLQESARLQGHDNPAVKDYIWNLTAGGVHDCVCPDLAADSPYIETEIPDYPHSNCLCYITYRLLSRTEFINDLRDWNNGLVVPYLESWYQDTYLNY